MLLESSARERPSRADAGDPGDGSDEDTGANSGQEAAGDEDVEVGEYCAAVADGEMECDLDRQWKRVSAGLQKAELLATQKRELESAMRQKAGCEGFADQDLGRRIRQSMQDAGQAVGNVERMQNHIEMTHQQIQATRPPPGIAAPRVAAASAPAEHDRQRMPRVRQRKMVRVVVPTGSEPVSMFSPDFWSAFDPVAFPYGDGVFGIERDTNLSYTEWCQYMMSREELEYACGEHRSQRVEKGSKGAPSQTALRWRRPCLGGEATLTCSPRSIVYGVGRPSSRAPGTMSDSSGLRTL